MGIGHVHEIAPMWNRGARAGARLWRLTAGLASIVGLGYVGAAGCAVDASDGEALAGEAEEAIVAGQTCINLVRGATTVEDTYLHSGLPGTNFGGSTSLQVGPSAASLVEFDLSPVPSGVNFAKATLTLRTIAGSGAAVNVHRSTAPWSEGTATYASNGGAFAPAVEATFPSTVGFHSTSVLPLVLDWLNAVQPNHGFYVESSGWSSMYSSEAAGSRPALRVCWYSDLDGDGYDSQTDCDDNDASINPGAAEVCDGIDNDCDGSIEGPAVCCGPLTLSTAAGSAVVTSAAGDAHIEVANLSIPADFTIEAWINPTTVAPVNQMVINKEIANDGLNQFRLQLFGSQAVFLMTDASGDHGGLFDPSYNLASTSLIPAGTWTHLAVTKSGTDFVLYVNGCAEDTLTTSANLVHTGTATFMIGSRFYMSGGLPYPFDGTIDEVRIWDVARPASGIVADRDNPIYPAHPDYANLLAYYRLDDGAGTTASDEKGAHPGTLVNGAAWVTSTAPIVP